MRLRNIPRAEGVLQAHPIVIKEENNQKGKWNQRENGCKTENRLL